MNNDDSYLGILKRHLLNAETSSVEHEELLKYYKSIIPLLKKLIAEEIENQRKKK